MVELDILIERHIKPDGNGPAGSILGDVGNSFTSNSKTQGTSSGGRRGREGRRLRTARPGHEEAGFFLF